MAAQRVLYKRFEYRNPYKVYVQLDFIFYAVLCLVSIVTSCIFITHLNNDFFSQVECQDLLNTLNLNLVFGICSIIVNVLIVLPKTKCFNKNLRFVKVGYPMLQICECFLSFMLTRYMLVFSENLASEMF